MAVWEYWPNMDDYAALGFVAEGDFFEVYSKFVGKPIADIWTPISVYTAPEGSTVVGDFPGLPAGDPPVFSERAVEILAPLISASVEMLPLRWLGHETTKIYAINVLEVVDCLDHSRSDIERFSTGRIMQIRHHVFKEDCLEGKHIFKLPEMPSSVYVSDTFKSLVEEHNLRGLNLQAV